MRVAIPVWEDKVSPVFDTASTLLIVEVDDHSEASRFIIFLDEQNLTRRRHRIQGLEVDVLICGAISRPFSRMLLGSGVEVIQEISGPFEEVLNAYLQGNIFNSKFLMPGCRKKRYRYGNRRKIKFEQNRVKE